MFKALWCRLMNHNAWSKEWQTVIKPSGVKVTTLVYHRCDVCGRDLRKRKYR